LLRARCYIDAVFIYFASAITPVMREWRSAQDDVYAYGNMRAR